MVEFLGGDNMFKRYVFGDGKWLFVNGYSLTIFEEALTKDMMDKMVRKSAACLLSSELTSCRIL